MISVKFYTFSKRENSTKQPPSTGGTEIRCNLKDGCDFLAPVIEISYNGNPTGFNYAYIADFGRYYFVSNWTYYRGLWAATLAVDVLASWKTEIGASTQYVTRAASDSDGTITDEFYPTKNAITNENVSITSPFANSFDDGCFIVSIISGTYGSVGGVTYYIMSVDVFSNFCRYMMSDDFISGMTFGTVTDDYMKATFDPLKYITGAMWFPCNPVSSGVWISTPIKCGWWTLPTSWPVDNEEYDMKAYILDATASGIYAFTNTDVTLPRHPQAAARGVYMNGAPFSQYILHFGPFGDINMDPAMLADLSGSVNKILLDFKLDFITGKGWLQLSTGLRTLRVIEAQLGVPVQVSSIGTNVNAIQRAIGRAAHGWENIMDILGTTSLTDSIVSAYAKAGDVASMYMAAPENAGNTGSMLAYNTPTYVQGIFFTAVDDAPDHYGKPLCKNKVINTLSGYVQTGSADIAIPSTAEENAQIVTFMNGGFFYE